MEKSNNEFPLAAITNADYSVNIAATNGQFFVGIWVMMEYLFGLKQLDF